MLASCPWSLEDPWPLLVGAAAARSFLTLLRSEACLAYGRGGSALLHSGIPETLVR